MKKLGDRTDAKSMCYFKHLKSEKQITKSNVNVTTVECQRNDRFLPSKIKRNQSTTQKKQRANYF